MANYKQLYAQSQRLVEKYQQDVVPKLRGRIQELEQQQTDTIVRCGQCRNSFVFTDLSGKSSLLCTEIGRRGLSEQDYCSFGRRRKLHAEL